MISAPAWTGCRGNTVTINVTMIIPEKEKNVWYSRKNNCLHEPNLTCKMPLFLLVYTKNKTVSQERSSIQDPVPIVQTYYTCESIKLGLSSVNNGC